SKNQCAPHPRSGCGLVIWSSEDRQIEPILEVATTPQQLHRHELLGNVRPKLFHLRAEPLGSRLVLGEFTARGEASIPMAASFPLRLCGRCARLVPADRL